jgi:hypothetical protein
MHTRWECSAGVWVVPDTQGKSLVRVMTRVILSFRQPKRFDDKVQAMNQGGTATGVACGPFCLGRRLILDTTLGRSRRIAGETAHFGFPFANVPHWRRRYEADFLGNSYF